MGRWAFVLFCSPAFHSFCLLTSCTAELWYTNMSLGLISMQHSGSNSYICSSVNPPSDDLLVANTSQILFYWSRIYSEINAGVVHDYLRSLRNTGVMTAAAAWPPGKRFCAGLWCPVSVESACCWTTFSKTGNPSSQMQSDDKIITSPPENDSAVKANSGRVIPGSGCFLAHGDVCKYQPWNNSPECVNVL